MSPRTAAEAIARAWEIRPAAFMTLDVDCSLTRAEYGQQEAQMAFAVIYGHLAPERRA